MSESMNVWNVSSISRMNYTHSSNRIVLHRGHSQVVKVFTDTAILLIVYQIVKNNSPPTHICARSVAVCTHSISKTVATISPSGMRNLQHICISS